MIGHRKPFVQTRRDAWVEINLSSIEQNVKNIRKQLNSNVKLLAVVKADAYGHGSTMTAPTILASGVDMLGVASVDEGIQLREAGINSPILVLGTAPNWSFASAVEYDIDLSIYSFDHLKECINVYKRINKKPNVHIKLNTGMNRIGINQKDSIDFIKEVTSCEYVQTNGVFTHLACAENTVASNVQNDKFKNILNESKVNNCLIHAANTAGLFSYKEMHYDMARAGIGIYGLMPDLATEVQNNIQLKQVMSLKGRIVNIQILDRGQGISYGFSYVTSFSNTKIATIPIGYADGVSRSLSNKIYGLINGKKVRQVGNITMDQMMFDITDIDNVNVGDVITLIGEDGDEFISIDSWANKLDTINYEVTCRLRVRLPRVYTR
ncbi:MAG: alanine racemase [bacterium]